MDLQLEPGEELLTARISGEFSLQEAKDILVRVFEAAVQHRLSRVLMDSRELQGSITVSEDYEHAVFGAKLFREYLHRGLPLRTRVAFVTKGSFHDPTNFAANVARDRGVVTRAFATVDEAIEWLGEGPTH